jgi:hypothetical protein
MKFWREARAFLKQMYFKILDSEQRQVPPTLKNLIVTL